MYSVIEAVLDGRAMGMTRADRIMPFLSRDPGDIESRIIVEGRR